MYVLPGYYGHINKMLAKHMVKSLSSNALVVIVVRVNGSSLDTYDINGIGCRIGSGLDCATNRNSSTPLCGSCNAGIAKF